jgi:hypothetical protein
LVGYFNEYHWRDAEQEYVDLGTPLSVMGSGSKFDQDCAGFLAKTASVPGEATVRAAIIDLGKDSLASPDNYGGRLSHAVTGNIELSDHAEKVLSVLLERLDNNGLLPNTSVSCALVRPPAVLIGIGKSCFEQSTAVELLDAVKALDAHLAKPALPTAINVSLGTHVGPHNGDSPLEEYISDKMVKKNDRFLIASAGNDGGRGRGGKRQLVANEREFLSVHTGPRCKDLLVEFWWDDSNNASLSIEANIYEIVATGGRALHGVVRIDPNVAGATLNVAPAGLPGHMVTHSLFSGKCRNNLSCTAFTISTTRAALPLLEVLFAIDAATDVIANAWIVVSDRQTAFVEGGQDGSIMVPASDTAVLSVTGAKPGGEIWEGSSRGPAAQYQSVRIIESSPLMAHLAQLSGEYGTSYASPRACADTLVAMADAGKRKRCDDAVHLICEAYGLSYNTLPDWNPRIGFYKRTS